MIIRSVESNEQPTPLIRPCRLTDSIYDEDCEDKRLCVRCALVVVTTPVVVDSSMPESLCGHTCRLEWCRGQLRSHVSRNLSHEVERWLDVPFL